ncbi:hypothetical protein ACRAWF_06710 [Streptomyces sp. L7]
MVFRQIRRGPVSMGAQQAARDGSGRPGSRRPLRPSSDPEEAEEEEDRHHDEVLSELVLQRSRSVLVVALLLTVLGGAAGATLFGKLTAGGLTNKGSESGQATCILEKNGQGHLHSPSSSQPARRVRTRPPLRRCLRLTERLAKEKDVVNVTSYSDGGRPPQLRSEKGDKAPIGATIRGDETSRAQAARRTGPPVRGHPRRPGRQGRRLRDVPEGRPTEISQKRRHQGEMIAFPLTR